MNKLQSKVAKATVDYSKGHAAAHCAICVNYRSPNACMKVQGRIDPSYWCKLFAKRAK